MFAHSSLRFRVFPCEKRHLISAEEKENGPFSAQKCDPGVNSLFENRPVSTKNVNSARLTNKLFENGLVRRNAAISLSIQHLKSVIT